MVFLLDTAGLEAQVPADSHGACVADVKGGCSIQRLEHGGTGMLRCPST